MLAGAAFSAEDEPAQHGNIVVERDEAAAMRASRTRRDHRLAEGQAVDADVQEAAESQPPSEDHGFKNRFQIS